MLNWKLLPSSGLQPVSTNRFSFYHRFEVKPETLGKVCQSLGGRGSAVSEPLMVLAINNSFCSFSLEFHRDVWVLRPFNPLRIWNFSETSMRFHCHQQYLPNNRKFDVRRINLENKFHSHYVRVSRHVSCDSCAQRRRSAGRARRAAQPSLSSSANCRAVRWTGKPAELHDFNLSHRSNEENFV